ncbi:hypothetical protein ERO13_D10G133900v2 [Gossypium hirsutum]|uniref:Uncharacterized protein n=4 Tax=Gossypium TaxID=3633 RepID=A0A5J5NEH1_GOSBA|nr:hypothetical protein [Gossypium barbadense]KAG4126055.1 hypothetical protein ERO13_D10G133900v2 [Gossypium hirsutum]TYG50220.1 hypothetical protein ES288_D10G156900v1 [Gossypium darwinii]TYH49781.1 hypothetical protein ES332_D10G158800v1 [Gossypium tomentosum]TYI61121.1 hypothetical protein E1A91_D10G150600v1 [Gossypium mustelinum]
MMSTHISKQATIYATQKETYKFMLTRLDRLNLVHVFLQSLFSLNSLTDISRLTVFTTSRFATYKARFHNFKHLNVSVFGTQLGASNFKGLEFGED